jgi:hypothetical protein
MARQQQQQQRSCPPRVVSSLWYGCCCCGPVPACVGLVVLVALLGGAAWAAFKFTVQPLISAVNSRADDLAGLSAASHHSPLWASALPVASPDYFARPPLAPSTAPPAMPPLPYQAHSFNDVAGFRGLVMKGVRWFKVDAALCEKEACEAQSTFGQPGRGGEEDCVAVAGLASPVCCICLRGDASARPALTQPFSTGWDLVKFFDADSTETLLKAAVRSDVAASASTATSTASSPPSLLYFGLSWGGQAGGSIFGHPSSSLVRTWLLALADVVRARDLPVRFYGDFLVRDWFLDLDKACIDGLPSCTGADRTFLAAFPPDRFFVEQPVPFRPDFQDPQLRVRLLNMDVGELPALCNGSANAEWDVAMQRSSPGLPSAWWAVSSQREILRLFDVYAACRTLPPSRRDPAFSLLAVSNVNPEMFEVFASSRMRRGLSVPLFPSAFPPHAPSGDAGASRHPQWKEPRIIIVPAASGVKAWDAYALLVVRDTSGMVGGGGSSFLLLALGVVHGSAPSAERDVLHSVRLPVPPSDTVVSLAVVQVPPVAAQAAGSVAAGPYDSPDETVRVLVATREGLVLVFPFARRLARFGAVRVTRLSLSATGGNDGLLSATAVCASSDFSKTQAGRADAAKDDDCALVTILAGRTTAGLPRITLAAYRFGSPDQQLSTLVLVGAEKVDAGASIALLSADPAGAAEGGADVHAFEGLAIWARRQPLTRAAAGLDVPASTTTSSSSSFALRDDGTARLFVVDAASDVAAGLEASIRRDAAATPLPAAFPPAVVLPALQLDADRRAHLYGAYVRVVLRGSGASLSAALTAELGGGGGGASPPRLGFGSAPHVALARHDDGRTVALLVYNDGSCDCGLYLNNANTARCEIPRPSRDAHTSFNFLQSVPFLLTASYGLLADWRGLVNGVAPAEVDRLLGHCNAKIVTGKFETGVAVTAALYVGSVRLPLPPLRGPGAGTFGAAEREVAVLTLHDGDVKGVLLTSFFCGGPEVKPGLVWGQWRLPTTAVLAA